MTGIQSHGCELYKTFLSLVLDTRIPASMTVYLQTPFVQVSSFLTSGKVKKNQSLTAIRFAPQAPGFSAKCPAQPAPQARQAP